MKIFGFLFLLIAVACGSDESRQAPHHDEPFRMAFMADVHFHDVFGDFEEDLLQILPLEADGQIRHATIRSMGAQITSTRLFNENYFAFKAALEDVVARGISHVALPGDFSDDGQPVHLRGLRQIMLRYQEEHGLHFFITPGNHDPSRPFTRPAGKRDYLGRAGREQPVYSMDHERCRQDPAMQAAEFSQQQHDSPPVICTDEVVEYGYDQLFKKMGEFGAVPTPETRYFETPFSTYHPDNYSFETALYESRFENRQFEICHEGSGGRFKEDHFTHCFEMMDMSYLVEPVEGLWLLLLDANVYMPRSEADSEEPEDPRHFMSSGNAGYNRVVTHKKHLLEWIGEVTERAERRGITVMAASHYPAVDFYHGAGDKIRQLWGEGRFQTARIPEKSTSAILASAGLRFHVGGHMHMNDTGVYRDETLPYPLVNIQSPSLAAYPPAYKVVHWHRQKNQIEVETAVLEEVPGFDTLFPLYEEEWDYLQESGAPDAWCPTILESENYYQFAERHLEQLVTLRFLPGEWPDDLRFTLPHLNGLSLLAFTLLDPDLIFKSDLSQGWNPVLVAGESPGFIRSWEEAINLAQEQARFQGFDPHDLKQWNGHTLITDLYRLRNAGQWAWNDIPYERGRQYALIKKQLSGRMDSSGGGHELFPEQEIIPRTVLDVQRRFYLLFRVLTRFATGEPDRHFILDLEDGTITDFSESRNPFLDGLNVKDSALWLPKDDDSTINDLNVLNQPGGPDEDPAAAIERFLDFYHTRLSTEEAVEFAERSIYRADSLGRMPLKAKALLRSGVLWKNAGNYPKSFERLDEAKDLFGDLGMEKEVHVVLRELGDTFRAGGQHDMAIKVLKEALAYFHLSEDPEQLAWTYNRLLANGYEMLYSHPEFINLENQGMLEAGNILERFKQHPELLDLYHQVWAWLGDAAEWAGVIDLPSVVASNKNLEASLHVLIHEVETAVHLYEDLIAYIREKELQRHLPLALINKARLLGQYRLNRPQEAIQTALQALELADNKGILVYRWMAMEVLHDNYLAVRDYENAYLYLSIILDILQELQRDRFLLDVKMREFEYLINERDLELGYRQFQVRLLGVSVGVISLLFGLFFLMVHLKNREKNRLLEELERKNRMISEKNRELEESNDAKEYLFSIIAHDLRNPLNGMLGLSEALLEEYRMEKRDGPETYLSMIHRSALQIMQLLENLLEWSRAIQGKVVFAPEKVVLQTTTQRVMDLFEDNAEKKKIRWVLDVPEHIMVQADINMLETILRNLISNALKFSGEGGEVRILAEEENGWANITIQDTGTGITVQEQQSLFSMESRLTKKGTHGEKGTGLGLLLCRDFVERHGGSIRVESEPGKGSSFTFRLPLG